MPYMSYRSKRQGTTEDGAPVARRRLNSIRLSRELLAKVDKLAADVDRTRAGIIERLTLAMLAEAEAAPLPTGEAPEHQTIALSFPRRPNISVRMSQETWDRLDALCAAKGRSRSELIENVVQRAFKTGPAALKLRNAAK